MLTDLLNLTYSQTRQQTWYDKKERARIIQSGDKALVMLQSDNSKLLAKWQGSFEVIQKLGSITYEIAFPVQIQSKWILHINLLKEWQERSDAGVEFLMLCRVKDEDEVHEHYLPISSSATLDLQHHSLHLQTGD